MANLVLGVSVSGCLVLEDGYVMPRVAKVELPQRWEQAKQDDIVGRGCDESKKNTWTKERSSFIETDSVTLFGADRK